MRTCNRLYTVVNHLESAMKLKVKRTFYNNRKMYIYGQEYDTAHLPKDIVKDYFEQPKRERKKKAVSKPESEVKKDQATENLEQPKPKTRKAKVVKSDGKPKVIKSEELEPLEENASEE